MLFNLTDLKTVSTQQLHWSNIYGTPKYPFHKCRLDFNSIFLKKLWNQNCFFLPFLVWDDFLYLLLFHHFNYPHCFCEIIYQCPYNFPTVDVIFLMNPKLSLQIGTTFSPIKKIILNCIHEIFTAANYTFKHKHIFFRTTFSSF